MRHRWLVLEMNFRKMKKISIIIATYNAAHVLQRCLDSIRPQKTEDVELVIVDGLSTDETMQIVKNNNDIIDLAISEKDNGIYDAWNKGITHSSGQWIMFIGADDQLSVGAIDAYLDFVKRSGADLDYVSAQLLYLDMKGNAIRTIGEAWRWSKFKRKMNVAHVTSLHNVALFEEVGLFDTNYKICADYELLLRKKELLRAAFMPKIVANMTIGGVSFTTQAIEETCQILSLHTKLSPIERVFMRAVKYAEFYFFKFRKSLFYSLK